MQIFSWALAYQIDPPAELPSAQPGLRVAFITTFVPGSESIDLLHKCLPALLSADYPHDTWLLDEGNSAEARELCDSLGVLHFSRFGIPRYNQSAGKFTRKTKGGNHNAWYDQHGDKYDVVAQLDTDFVPTHAFLSRTLGYFQDPEIGFVGTPQIYGNASESLIARGAAEQAYNFYGPILRGFSGMKTTLLIGANHIIRVAALKSVDYYSAHITEDVLTGMKLHAAGWKSVYVPEALAIGEGPENWQSYFIQQLRWAYGSIDVLFRQSPALLRRMTLRRAAYYFFLLQHYLSGLAMGLGLIGLGLYAGFGITTARVGLPHFLEYYLPVVLVCEVMSLFLQRFNIQPKSECGFMAMGRIISIAAWPLYFIALSGVLLGKRLTYVVTPKGSPKNARPTISLRLFVAHYLIAGYCIACFVLAIVDNHRSVIMLFWLALSAFIMLNIPFAEFIRALFYRTPGSISDKPQSIKIEIGVK